MIDNDGYRSNVGIIICNQRGQVFWARRYGQNSWQFPQGGINDNETPEQAMFRELNEEVGLLPKDVKILATTNGWLRYKLPKRMIRWENEPVCIGQKQKWFLLELEADVSRINLSITKSPEFDNWKWVSYWYPTRQVITFKREVYRKAMKEFSNTVFALQVASAEKLSKEELAKQNKNQVTKKRKFSFFFRRRKSNQKGKDE